MTSKKSIEKAAKDMGTSTVNWNADEQKIHITYDAAKTSSDKILKHIANVGHDNEKYTSETKVYDKLPKCCLYDRNFKWGEKNPLVHMDEEEETPKQTTKTEDEHAGHNHAKEANQIDGVTVTKAKAATALSKKEVGLTFNIDSKELLKAACCNLSESFETNATVDVSFSNAVTGTKQLKMLGLDQKYTSLT